MSRGRSILGVIVLLAVLAIGLVPTAAGQENRTDTDQEQSGLDEDPIAVDETLTITSWSYDEGSQELTIEFNATRPTTVTITEAASADSGRTGELSITRERVLPGESTLTLSVSPGPVGEVAVVVTTTESVDREQGVFLSTGQDATPQPSPFAGTSPTAGWIGGASLSLVTVVLAGIYRMRREATEPEVAG
jgi:hypothetical protein